MRHAYGLDIPETLHDLCDPGTMAVIAYDMQVGVLSQIPDGQRVISRVREVLDAARAGGYRVFFTRHMNLPPAQAGISQLRRAMAWQQVASVQDLAPFLERDSPEFAIIPELTPQPGEIVFDKTAMSAFAGTPLDMVMRDCRLIAYAIVGVALEVGIGPTVWHSADLGYIPVVVQDACGGRNTEAQERLRDAMIFTGDAILTDTAAITPLLRSQPLATERTRDQRQRQVVRVNSSGRSSRPN